MVWGVDRIDFPYPTGDYEYARNLTDVMDSGLREPFRFTQSLHFEAQAQSHLLLWVRKWRYGVLKDYSEAELHLALPPKFSLDATINLTRYTLA